jgi:release factor glutamine methyltransferase
MINLSQLFQIQKALKKVKYPDYKRVSKEIAEFVDSDKKLKKVLDGIKKDKPAEYISGSAKFYTFTFKVNQNVMIPRIETEKIVAMAIKEFKDNDFDTVIDVGTGSGCIIISLVKSLMLPTIHKGDIDNTEFIATDKSIKALRVARANIKNFKLDNKIESKKMDLIKKLELDGKKVLLLANLPYIPTKQYEKLEKSVKKYEPKGSLEGGKTGNKYYKKLLEQIEEKNIKKFTLILETEESILNKTEAIFKEYDSKIVKDIYDKDRFLVVNS